MATSLHVGRKRIVTITASDASSIPLGSLTVSSVGGGITAVVNPATNEVTVTGVVPGTYSVTYSAAGYQNAIESFTVSPLPTLIYTDGPEI